MDFNFKCKYCGKKTVKKYCSECKDNLICFDRLESLTGDIELVFKATSYPWKAELTSETYEIFKCRPGTHWDSDEKLYVPKELVYEKDGYEYLKCYDNQNVPFIIHARIADANAESDKLELDDLNRPNIQEEYTQDINSYNYLDG